MSENKSYQKKLSDVITFTHIFRYPTSHVAFQRSSLFSTIYKTSLINWECQIEKVMHGFIPLFVPRTEPQKFQIVLTQAGMRDKYPPIQRVAFQMKILDSPNEDEKENTKIYTYETCQPDPEDMIFRRNFRTPEDSEFSKMISLALTDIQYRGKYIEIAIALEFDTKSFCNVDNFTDGQAVPLPLELGFKFNSLKNSNCHDFELRTIDGIAFRTRKELLFISSRFFRTHLTSSKNFHVLDVQNPEAIEIAVTYLFTCRYKVPEKMTPKLANEILSLACLFAVKRISMLRRSVERQCYEEIQKNYENLEFIVEMLISSKDVSMDNVKNSCVATIINYHLREFDGLVQVSFCIR
ncbi:unnamed protein product [Caenorhabditis angaria]|uniref:BTB domain-containing protein n=1 Tax=Caenorhabditis angaria TaxID=860376 RepID=A0A9P1IBS8_9PELO|nr:unnamed protein product [Caenorhabditis angaria]